LETRALRRLYRVGDGTRWILVDNAGAPSVQKGRRRRCDEVGAVI